MRKNGRESNGGRQRSKRKNRARPPLKKSPSGSSGTNTVSNTDQSVSSSLRQTPIPMQQGTKPTTTKQDRMTPVMSFETLAKEMDKLNPEESTFIPVGSSRSISESQTQYVSKATTSNCEPAVRGRWFWRVQKIIMNKRDEDVWSKKTGQIKEIRDGGKYKHAPLAPRLAGRNPPTKHPSEITMTLVEYNELTKKFVGALRHKVIKLKVPEEEDERKGGGYNSLLHYKEAYKTRFNKVPETTKKTALIAIAVHDVFQIESLNMKLKNEWFADLQNENLASVNVTFKHFSKYLGNCENAAYPIEAPSPSVSPKHSPTLEIESSVPNTPKSDKKSNKKKKSPKKDRNDRVAVQDLERAVGKLELNAGGDGEPEAFNSIVKAMEEAKLDDATPASKPSTKKGNPAAKSKQRFINGQEQAVEKPSEKTKRRRKRKSKSPSKKPASDQPKAKPTTPPIEKQETSVLTQTPPSPSKNSKRPPRTKPPNNDDIGPTSKRKLEKIAGDATESRIPSPEVKKVKPSLAEKSSKAAVVASAEKPKKKKKAPAKRGKKLSVSSDTKPRSREQSASKAALAGLDPTTTPLPELTEIRLASRFVVGRYEFRAFMQSPMSGVTRFPRLEQEFPVQVREDLFGNRRRYGIVVHVEENFNLIPPGDVFDVSGYNLQRITVQPFLQGNPTSSNADSFQCKLSTEQMHVLSPPASQVYFFHQSRAPTLKETPFSVQFRLPGSGYTSENLPPLTIGTLISYIFAPPRDKHPRIQFSSIAPYYNMLEHMEKTFKMFPALNLGEAVLGYQKRQLAFANFLKAPYHIPARTVAEDKENFILNRADQESKKLKWHGRKYLMQRLKSGEPGNLFLDEVKKVSIDRESYKKRPVVNPCLILKRYKDIVDRANENSAVRQDDCKKLDIELEAIIANAGKDRKTMTGATKAQECLRLTTSGSTVLDTEINLLAEALPKALAAMPQDLVLDVIQPLNSDK